jgi:D-serine dehydratase
MAFERSAMTDISSTIARSFAGGRLPDGLTAGHAVIWTNPYKQDGKGALERLPLSFADVQDAENRWKRFGPVLKTLFPDLASAQGRIDSPLLRPNENTTSAFLPHGGSKLLIKCDHALPITGSIKARGGVYEVLWFAEKVAFRHGLLTSDCSYELLTASEARALYSQYTFVVGSTGNLGFSVGLMARALGFSVEVHMSSDAKRWKKDRLRNIGANVIEHAADYCEAVATARRVSADRSDCHFIDDEGSVHLFLGYAVAALDLKIQLEALNIPVTPQTPLVVYLPCGVGGAPGGITFGLKHLYGDAVHCILVEPVQSPCMLVQLVAGLDQRVSVYDVGLTNETEADGLAVPAASMFVARTVRNLIDQIVTVRDDDLFSWARQLWFTESLRLEPSAAAGFAALDSKLSSVSHLLSEASTSTHVIWTTGGSLLPDDVFADVLRRGEWTQLSSGGYGERYS